jgi:hypothetical protein
MVIAPGRVMVVAFEPPYIEPPIGDTAFLVRTPCCGRHRNSYADQTA